MRPAILRILGNLRQAIPALIVASVNGVTGEVQNRSLADVSPSIYDNGVFQALAIFATLEWPWSVILRCWSVG